jgi:hypothetical protein
MSYGNGQVSPSFDTIRNAERARCAQRDFSRRIGQAAGTLTIQRLDTETGDWIPERYWKR